MSKLSLTLHTFSVTGSVASLFLTIMTLEKPKCILWRLTIKYNPSSENLRE